MKRAIFLLGLSSMLVTFPTEAQQGPRIAHQSIEGRPFSPAIQVGKTYWLSGKLGATRQTREMNEGRTAAETHNIMRSFQELLGELSMDLSNVVSATVYLTDIADFSEMNAAYTQYFPREAPARVTVAVAGLVGGAKLEISFIAVED